MGDEQTESKKEEVQAEYEFMLKQALEQANLYEPANQTEEIRAMEPYAGASFRLSAEGFDVVASTVFMSDESGANCSISLSLIGAGDRPSMINSYTVGDVERDYCWGDGRIGLINRTVTADSKKLVAQLAIDLNVAADSPVAFLRAKAPQIFQSTSQS